VINTTYLCEDVVSDSKPKQNPKDEQIPNEEEIKNNDHNHNHNHNNNSNSNSIKDNNKELQTTYVILIFGLFIFISSIIFILVVYCKKVEKYEKTV
jgi:hypothetical protein